MEVVVVGLVGQQHKCVWPNARRKKHHGILIRNIKFLFHLFLSCWHIWQVRKQLDEGSLQTFLSKLGCLFLSSLINIMVATIPVICCIMEKRTKRNSSSLFLSFYSPSFYFLSLSLFFSFGFFFLEEKAWIQFIYISNNIFKYSST